jgi:Tfp pilus assembly protein PilV
VALAVMAIGMLGVVGLQSTLRANSDISKQRAEGVRLAQEKLEDLRFFRDVTGAAASYTGIIGSTETFDPDPVLRPTNTTFTRTTTVTSMDARAGVPDLQALPRAKNVSVTVSWPDRSGQTQSVTLTAAIAGIAPALAGSLAVPPDGGDAMRQPLNRNAGIPRSAVNLGDGDSAFVPPASPSGVVWVFNNVTGLLQACRLTAPALVRANIDTCTGFARLIQGYVRFSLAGAPTYAEALQPTSSRPADLNALRMTVVQSAPTAGLVECAVDAAATHPSYTEYFCAVPVPDAEATTTWGGALRAESAVVFFPVTPPPAPAVSYRLCRYRAEASYSAVSENLLNQNFFVIGSAHTCPAPPLVTPPDPRPPTVQHQPP